MELTLSVVLDNIVECFKDVRGSHPPKYELLQSLVSNMQTARNTSEFSKNKVEGWYKSTKDKPNGRGIPTAYFRVSVNNDDSEIKVNGKGFIKYFDEMQIPWESLQSIFYNYSNKGNIDCTTKFKFRFYQSLFKQFLMYIGTGSLVQRADEFLGNLSENEHLAIADKCIANADNYMATRKIRINDKIIPCIGDAEISSLHEFVIAYDEKAPIVIYGKSGAGKTCVLLNCIGELSFNPDYLPLYIPIASLRKDVKNPVLQFIFESYLFGYDGCEAADRIYESIIKLSGGTTRLIFLLDGLNEANVDIYDKVLDGIRWLAERDNTVVIVGSRSAEDVENSNALKILPLTESQITNYLKSEITDLQKQLFKSPMMLAYYKELSPSEKIDTPIKLFKAVIEREKKMYERTNQMKIDFIFDALLPQIAFETSMTKELSVAMFTDYTFKALHTLLSIDNLMINYEGYKADLIVFSKERNKPFYELINTVIIKTDTSFLSQSDEKIIWNHDLFRAYFTAKGFFTALLYQRQKAVDCLAQISNAMFDSKADDYSLMAQYLCEMLAEDVSNDKIFVKFIMELGKLAVAFDASKFDEILKPAQETLKMLNNAHLKEYTEIYANLLSGVAYRLISAKNMGEDDCIEIAKASLEKANDEISKCEKTSRSILIEAKINANLGAYYLKIEDYDMAIDKHKYSLKLKEDVLKAEPNTPGKNYFLARSHIQLATDYYYKKEYTNSLAHHYEAIKLINEDGIKEIEKVKSFTRCLGTIEKLISYEDTKDGRMGYLEKAIVIIERIFELLNVIKGNTSEINSFKLHFKNIRNATKNDMRNNPHEIRLQKWEAELNGMGS